MLSANFQQYYGRSVAWNGICGNNQGRSGLIAFATKEQTMNPQDPEYAEKPYDFDPATMQDDRLGQTAVTPDPYAPDTDTPRDHLRQGGDATNAPDPQQRDQSAKASDDDAPPPGP
jgi:hypothetical protein